jgi:hypothetical protein
VALDRGVEARVDDPLHVGDETSTPQVSRPPSVLQASRPREAFQLQPCPATPPSVPVRRRREA